MIEHKELIAIYTQLPVAKEQGREMSNSYFILYMFNDKGLIDLEVLRDIYNETHSETVSDICIAGDANLIGPFSEKLLE